MDAAQEQSRVGGRLITCDLICLGVGSPGMFQEYLTWLEGASGEQVLHYAHRPAGEVWGHNQEAVVFKSGKMESGTNRTRLWKRVRSRHVIRPCCYECAYHSCERPGNLTIGDYWGLESAHPGFADALGVSCLWINDEGGMDVAISIASDLQLIESSVDACANESQPMLRKPPALPESREAFWSSFGEGGFKAAMSSIGAMGLKRDMRDFAKRTRNRVFGGGKQTSKPQPIGTKSLEYVEQLASDGRYPRVFAAKHRNDEVRAKSSSGGVFSALARFVIDRGGVVYGCAFDELQIARHIRCETMWECERCMGSKYSQSDLGDTARLVCDDLAAGRLVLFTGTPCQVDAIRSTCEAGWLQDCPHSVRIGDLPEPEKPHERNARLLFPLLESRYRFRDGSPLRDATSGCAGDSTRFTNWDSADSLVADKLPELYVAKRNCCGCTVCAAACPKGAISMEYDEEGFLYPVVNAQLCIGCGRCLVVCAYKKRNGAL